MAYESLGQSFLPRMDAGGGAQGGSRLEDVLRVLSFRLPRILGSRPIAPAELLNSQGGAGDPLGSAVAQQVLQQIMQGAPNVGGGGMGDMGGASPLSQLFAPIFGPGRIQSPADLPSQPKPRVLPIEEPPSIVEPNPSPVRTPFQSMRPRPRQA